MKWYLVRVSEGMSPLANQPIKMKTLLTPEDIPGSGSCVQLNAPGSLYIQSFDSYGFQREMTLRPIVESGFELQVYQHPGRREIRQLSRSQGRKLCAAILARVDSTAYRSLLFNSDMGGKPKNWGFVRLMETVFRGAEFSDILAQI